MMNGQVLARVVVDRDLRGRDQAPGKLGRLGSLGKSFPWYTRVVPSPYEYGVPFGAINLLDHSNPPEPRT